MNSSEISLLILSMINCPIGHETMEEPVRLNCQEEHSFERKNIELWLSHNQVCPICRTAATYFAPNRDIERLVNALDRTKQGSIEDIHVLAQEIIAYEKIHPSSHKTLELVGKIEELASRSLLNQLFAHIQNNKAIVAFMNGLALLLPYFRSDLCKAFIRMKIAEINTYFSSSFVSHSSTATSLLRSTADNTFPLWDLNRETKGDFSHKVSSIPRAERLRKEEADLRVENKFEYTPLHHAAISNNTEKARLLLKSGAQIEAKDEAEFTPLHHAVNRNSFEVVQIILQAGANIESKDKFGRTPLHHAAIINNVEVAQLLLLTGASMDSEDASRSTPLHHAANWNSFEVAELLLYAGADKEAKDQLNATPLHHAATWNSPKVAQLLLGAYANIEAKDHFGDTPLHLAITSNSHEVAQLLSDAGAKMEAKGEFRTASLIRTNFPEI